MLNHGRAVPLPREVAHIALADRAIPACSTTVGQSQPRSGSPPALERGPLSFVLLVFGVNRAALELTAPDRIAGRALLLIIITIAGIVGVLRRKQTRC